MKLNLEIYEIIFIVFFQVGIPDTSKCSTWKKIEKTGRQPEKILTNQRASFWNLEFKLEISKWNYAWIFPTTSSRFSNYSTWNGNIEKTGKWNWRNFDQSERPWKRDFFGFGTRDLGDSSSLFLLDYPQDYSSKSRYFRRIRIEIKWSNQNRGKHFRSESRISK